MTTLEKHHTQHDMAVPPPAATNQGTQAAASKARERFRQFASFASAAAGSPWTFTAAVLFLIIWACSYPWFTRFPSPFDTWQLVVNTVTTIVTFLMVFLIQNTQNRDAKAIHLKLDELIRAHAGARNRLVDLQNCSDEELERLRLEFERIRSRAIGKQKNVTVQKVAAVEMTQQNRASDA